MDLKQEKNSIVELQKKLLHPSFLMVQLGKIEVTRQLTCLCENGGVPS